MGKIKYLLLLILGTFIAASVYMFALKAHFFPIMAIYQVLAIISVCLYVFLFYRHNNEIGKARLSGKEPDMEQYKKRKKVIKLVVACLFPFVLVVLCDYIYLILLADNPLFQSIINFLK